MRLYKATALEPDRVGGTVSPPDYTDWRRDNAVFSEVAASLDDSVALTGSGDAEQIPAGVVTGGFFRVMGVPPVFGRAITTEDDAAGGRDVVVLSHALWTRRFGSSRGIIGRQLTIDGVQREVIGVMPPGFQYPLRSELWVARFSARDLERSAERITLSRRPPEDRHDHRPRPRRDARDRRTAGARFPAHQS